MLESYLCQRLMDDNVNCVGNHLRECERTSSTQKPRTPMKEGQVNTIEYKMRATLILPTEPGRLIIRPETIATDMASAAVDGS